MMPNHCFESLEHNPEANEIDIAVQFNSHKDPNVFISGRTRSWWNYDEEEVLTIFDPYYDTNWLMCLKNVTALEKLPLDPITGHTTW